MQATDDNDFRKTRPEIRDSFPAASPLHRIHEKFGPEFRRRWEDLRPLFARLRRMARLEYTGRLLERTGKYDPADVKPYGSPRLEPSNAYLEAAKSLDIGDHSIAGDAGQIWKPVESLTAYIRGRHLDVVSPYCLRALQIKAAVFDWYASPNDPSHHDVGHNDIRRGLDVLDGIHSDEEEGAPRDVVEENARSRLTDRAGDLPALFAPRHADAIPVDEASVEPQVPYLNPLTRPYPVLRGWKAYRRRISRGY